MNNKNYRAWLFSIGIHASILLVAILVGQFSYQSEPPVKPRVVQAELIVIKPKPKQGKAAAAAPSVKKKQVTKSKPKPKKVVPKASSKKKNVVKRKPKPKPVVKPKPKPEPVVIKKEKVIDDLGFDDLIGNELQDDKAAKQQQIEATQLQVVRTQFMLATQRQWSRPATARNGMSATMRVDLVPSGEVSAVSVIKSSGDEAFDREAKNAVKKAAPFEFVKKLDSQFFNKNIRTMTFVFTPEDLK